MGARRAKGPRQARGDAAQKGEGEAQAKEGVPAEAEKGLEGGDQKGPAGASPAAAAREPAAAGGGGGGAGGGGGGGDGGGGGADSPEAEALDEKLEEKKPEEEKEAEAQQDEEQEAAEGGGGGGEADAGGEGGGAEAEPGAGGGEAAPSPDETASLGGGGGDSADVDGGGGEPGPEADSGGTKTPVEQQLEAKQAPAVEEAKREEAEEKQSEQEQEEAEQPSPENAGGEEGQLSPAEKGAAEASVSEDAGGGAGAAAGGGGGGGGAIPDKPAPAAPDVSGSEPKAGLGSLKGQAPMAIKGALGGVSKSVGKTVGDRKQELAANPPTRAASSGMPGKKGPAAGPEEGADKGEKAEKVEEGEAVETPEPEPTPDAPPAAVNAVSAPQVSGGGEAEMSEADADRMGSAIQSMPTSDPEVSTSAGPPPTVALEGNADPAQVTAQRAKMDESISSAHEEGKADAQKPMGEDEIAPQETNETLAAKVPGGGGGAGGGGADGGGGGGADEEAASIIAHEKSQGDIDAAVEKGQGDMAQEEAKEKESSEAEKRRTQEEAAKAESEAASEQEAEKAAAKADVAKKRGEWSDEQQAAVDKSHTDAEEKQKEADEKVDTEKTTADEGASKEIESGEQKAEKEKEQGESKAEREKAKGKEESSGFFGWLASKAKAFFNKIKEAVKSVMKALREAVKAAIEAAKKAAVALIEKARQAIVAAIRLAGEALIAISDVALAAFPELKAKFQGAVRQAVQDAEDAVNKVADALKKGVEKLLDALGDFLDKALGLLEKALLAAVDAVAAVVDKAIKAAEAVAKALGTFMVLIKDIASGPGQWISNLGAAVVDGIKNHLVKAMKSAISEWFKSKVEEVLGIPIDLMKALFKGGFDLGKIGKMAWEALKTAIPGILIQLLIEKLVAMVVPAAGAVMAIIEGVQAAWGAISRIIAAIDAFITFLKAVKGGGAGPQFATAVAAGAVAVIDFVANWLLKRLMKPAKKVSGKLAAIAKKILAKIKKALKKVGKKLKKVFKKIGKKIKKAFKKVFGKKKKGKGKDKKKDKKKDKDKDKAKKKQERLDKAVKAIEPQLSKLLAKGVSGTFLKVRLALWRVRYRLSKLQLRDDGSVLAAVNPTHTLSNGRKIDGKRIGRVLQPIFAEAEREYLAALLRKDGMQQQHDQASANLAAGSPNALAGTHPAVSSSVLAGTQAPPGRHNTGRPDTSLFVPGGAQGPGQIKVNNITEYDKILKGLQKQFPVAGEENIARILATADPQQRQGLLQQLRNNWPGTTKTAGRQRETFLRGLNRTSFLLQELEPARLPGVKASGAISHSLAAGGHVAVSDVVGSKGLFATMQMKDVSARDDTPERRAARSESRTRTGNIAAALLQVAQSSKPIYAVGGYDLSDLANAIRRLLESRFVHRADPKTQEKHVAAVKAQIRLLLMSFHGD
ncbi:MAG: hypothetical protein R3B70_00420 [Polyangiaceae bacterium]